jgi:DNA-binding NarL/FixJ family response regulator
VEPRDGRPVVLLTLLHAADWTMLTRLLESRPDAAVVTFLDEPDVAAYSRAFAAGAMGVLPRTAGPASILETFDAALRDRVVLPASVVRALLAPSDGKDTRGAVRRVNRCRRFPGCPGEPLFRLV